MRERMMYISEFPTWVCVADINDFCSGDIPDRLLSVVSSRRREKIVSLRRETDRRLSLVAGLLLEKGLRAVTGSQGVERQNFHIAVNDSGKPYIPGIHGFHFNLSHSGNQVACAFSSREVGCDIQEHKGYSEDVARRFFTEEEYRCVVSQDGAEAQENTFFQIWTMKESLVKALGDKLWDHLPGVSMVSPEGVMICERRVGNRWFCFRQYTVQKGYSMTCCSSKKEDEIRLVRVREWMD